MKGLRPPERVWRRGLRVEGEPGESTGIDEAERSAFCTAASRDGLCCAAPASPPPRPCILLFALVERDFTNQSNAQELRGRGISKLKVQRHGRWRHDVAAAAETPWRAQPWNQAGALPGCHCSAGRKKAAGSGRCQSQRRGRTPGSCQHSQAKPNTHPHLDVAADRVADGPLQGLAGQRAVERVAEVLPCRVARGQAFLARAYGSAAASVAGLNTGSTHPPS